MPEFLAVNPFPPKHVERPPGGLMKFVFTFFLVSGAFGCVSPPATRSAEPAPLVKSGAQIGQPCGGSTNILCGDDAVCEYTRQELTIEDLNCAPDNVRPRATPRPCPDNYVPLCGCDGLTYGNHCEADMAGVSIRSGGSCPASRTVYRVIIRGTCRPR